MENLQVVYISPTDLKPYENNARHHTPHDIEAIKASIKEFGFSDPIGIWGENNLIVEGHGRQLAAIEMGLETVPCIRLDHMTEDQRKAYALAHNKTAELSGWDFLLLEEELAALSDKDFDMSEFGFMEKQAEQESTSDGGADGGEHGDYVEDFFDRGVEATPKADVFGVKVLLESEDQVEECMDVLSDHGYKPVRL